MKIGMMKLHVTAQEPTRANSFDAGWDLYSNEEVIILPQDEPILIGTGLVLAIPRDYAGLILPRSGLAGKFGVTVANSPGLIDSGYRGEVKVALVNHHPVRAHQVKKGDRIAQLMVVPFKKLKFDERNDLESLNSAYFVDERGDGGFGGSGK